MRQWHARHGFEGSIIEAAQRVRPARIDTAVGFILRLQ
jgi:hypothetical protein